MTRAPARRTRWGNHRASARVADPGSAPERPRPPFRSRPGRPRASFQGPPAEDRERRPARGRPQAPRMRKPAGDPEPATASADPKPARRRPRASLPCQGTEPDTGRRSRAGGTLPLGDPRPGRPAPREAGYAGKPVEYARASVPHRRSDSGIRGGHPAPFTDLGTDGSLPETWRSLPETWRASESSRESSPDPEPGTATLAAIPCRIDSAAKGGVTGEGAVLQPVGIDSMSAARPSASSRSTGRTVRLRRT